MKHAKSSKQQAKHYTWGENCDSWILAENQGISVKHETMPAGTKEKLHYHFKAQQYFFVLKGTAVFYAGNQKYELKEHEGILVEHEEQHFISNESQQNVEFLVISQPAIHNDRVNVEDKI